MTRAKLGLLLGPIFLGLIVTNIDAELLAAGAGPDAPQLVVPANGGTVSTTPTLSAYVSDPDGGILTVTASLRRVTAQEFTIIALPDTQYYSQKYPATFTAQTQWIVDNRDARNIVFVTHEGDIVQNAGTASEWQRADTSMKLLEVAGIPFGAAPGNHDQPTSLYNQYFGVSRYLGRSYYGGHYSTNNDNNFQLFSGGGMDFVIVHLDYCPPTAAVTWAAGVLAQYPDRVGIVTTHAYLDGSAKRKAGACVTQYLWDQLAVPSPNLRFMFAGHISGESRRTDSVGTRTVHQVMADYQERTNGGQGFLRIMRFVPADNKVYVQTYSPTMGVFETDAGSQFSLDFAMANTFQTVGSVNVLEGSDADFTPAGLAPLTTYEWRVTITDSEGQSRTGPTWTFTTGAGDGTVNQPPTATPQTVTVPEDASSFVTLAGLDPDGDSLTYTVVTGPAHGTLSGTAPTLTYTPTANYNGSDSFTFRVNDGHVNSAVATVAITVQSVNDPPSATGESHTVQGGSTLTVSAPGLLSNDTDIDNASLTAVAASSPSHGTLVLNANGSFSYTPALGYVGGDSFTYSANDGLALSSPATVSLTVTAPPPPVPVFTATFNSGSDSFSYGDNKFRNTSQSAYAAGKRLSSGGFTGGALQIIIGGKDTKSIVGMSGGYKRSFKLTAAAPSLAVTFRYNLDAGADYESGELSQVLVSINGVLVAAPPVDYVAQVTGDGDGGAAIGTGWQLVTIPLGALPKGSHEIAIGAYNSKKDGKTEITTLLIDDVTVAPQP